jgi:hypothetical protein
MYQALKRWHVWLIYIKRDGQRSRGSSKSDVAYCTYRTGYRTASIEFALDRLSPSGSMPSEGTHFSFSSPGVWSCDILWHTRRMKRTSLWLGKTVQDLWGLGECTPWIPHINYATAPSLLFNTDYTGNKSVLILWDLKSTWIMYQAFRPYFVILYPLWVTKTNTSSSLREGSLLSESHGVAVQRYVCTPSRYWGTRGITPLIHVTFPGKERRVRPEPVWRIRKWGKYFFPTGRLSWPLRITWW